MLNVQLEVDFQLRIGGMNLKHWMKLQRGRNVALANRLGVSPGRMSQIADNGVPDKYKLAVRDFTKHAVSLEEMVWERTPGLQAGKPV